LAVVVPVDPSPLTITADVQSAEDQKKQIDSQAKAAVADQNSRSRANELAVGPGGNQDATLRNSADQLNRLAGRYATQDPPTAGFSDPRNIAYLGRQNLEVQFQNGQFNLVDTNPPRLESRDGTPLPSRPMAKSTAANRDLSGAATQTEGDAAKQRSALDLAKNELDNSNSGRNRPLDLEHQFGAAGGGGRGGDIEMKAAGIQTDGPPPATDPARSYSQTDPRAGFETLLRNRRAVAQRTSPATDKQAQPQILNALIVIKFTDENPATNPPPTPALPPRSGAESGTDKK
jgi:hypothetical protein